MTAQLGPAGVDPAKIVAGLRLWAAGFSADEAAVELLAAIAREVPAVLDPAPVAGSPWLVPRPRPGVWSLDGAALGDAIDGFPSRMRSVVLVAAALATDGALVEVGVTLAGVPVEWLGPVFAALAHAAGCPDLWLVAAEPGLFGWLDPTPTTTALSAGPRHVAFDGLDGAA